MRRRDKNVFIQDSKQIISNIILDIKCDNRFILTITKNICVLHFNPLALGSMGLVCLFSKRGGNIRF